MYAGAPNPMCTGVTRKQVPRVAHSDESRPKPLGCPPFPGSFVGAKLVFARNIGRQSVMLRQYIGAIPRAKASFAPTKYPADAVLTVSSGGPG